jgi:hypothetical protein
MPSGPAAPSLPHLEVLARSRFPDLSAAELKLLSAAGEGTLAECGTNANESDLASDATHGISWGPERTIQADLIRWLAVHREAAALVDTRGIQVYGARITGELDLSSTAVPFPLRLV